MNALADALVAAQRRSIATLEKAYDLTGEDAERDAREDRERVRSESPREGTEA